jgi:D-alanine-D-alanine ligase-like ATP-grasp enzyme
VVFPVLHGEAGEDGSLREVLGLLGVPFVGSIGSACRVAFDKSVANRGGRGRARHARSNRLAARDLP